jgi:hypothetical protein
MPPDIPYSELIAAPETLTAEGNQLALTSNMWIDLQPKIPSGDPSFVAILYITTIDTDSINATIDADALWLVYNEQVWKSWITSETGKSAEQSPNRIIRVVRNGPKWGSNISVDVIVRVKDGQGNMHLLRASKQLIGTTY